MRDSSIVGKAANSARDQPAFRAVQSDHGSSTITAGTTSIQSGGMFHHIRSPGKLAQYPIIGLAMLVFGGLIFGVIAYSVVTHGPFLAWDVPLANSLHTMALNSPGWVNGVMIAGYYVGGQLIAVIGLVLGIYFLRKRCWRELTMLAVGAGGSGLLFRLTSNIFDRPRPVFESEIWKIHVIPGFPSGHASAVVAFYGLLAYFFVPKISSRLGKATMIAGALIIALYVGFSRIFVGHHFLTDLVAGYAMGIAWSGLAYTLIELIFRNKAEPAPIPQRLPNDLAASGRDLPARQNAGVDGLAHA
jgi:membrane-associated phospholipid phosphatase